MMIRCLIIDDDPLIIDLLKHFCDKSGKFSYALCVSNGKDGLRLINSEHFDLIFLDYNLPDMKGLDFLEMMSNSISVIMVTSESNFAVMSYEYDQIIDFLIKPLSYERFLKALERINILEQDSKSKVTEQSSNSVDPLFIKDGTSLVKIDFESIHFIKSESNYVSFAQSEKSIMSIMTMKDLELKLPRFFVRVHRSYFVNINFIKVINQDSIKMANAEIPIGDKYRSELLARIKQF
ncbi:MAG: response regulator transcription factor [Saprospiraceae bacterium]|nr:response regulator transcription factor [Saprospiraceae bacterium]